MNTRDAAYLKETVELLRIITTYKTLTSGQVYRLFPDKEAKTKTILANLIKQRRVFYDRDRDILSASAECAEAADAGMIAAFWVLLDFIDRTEYHTVSDFPVKICFFSDGEVYEIICVPPGQEALISHALTANNSEDPPRRLIVVDSHGQAADINVPNTAGFCIVAPDGVVTYYKHQQQ